MARFFGIFIFFVFICYGSLLSAQSSSKNLTRADYINASGLNPDSKFLKGFKREEKSELKIYNNQILAHHKSDNIYPIKAPQIKLPDSVMQKIKSKAHDYAKKVAEPLNTPFVTDCKKSKKHSYKVPNLHPQKDNKLIRDMLFVRKHSVDVSDKSVFGDKILDIHEYSRDRANPAYYYAYSYGVTCLPYRIRVGKNKVWKYTGSLALRHYEDDISDSGKRVKGVK